MITLLAATPNCLVYDDGEPLGNRSTTIQTRILPRGVEFAPGRGGVVLAGHRISLGHVWRCSEELRWSAGYIAGCYGLDERAVQLALDFTFQHPELIEPKDDEVSWWLDS